MRSLALLSVCLFFSGCVCDTGAENLEYFCSGADECEVGSRCDLVAQRCVPGELGEADAGVDAGTDTGADAGMDAGEDARLDAGADAGVDAGTDGGLDGGLDAGFFDAGFDAGGFIGARCTIAADCRGGRCVDGRCCMSECTNPCDFCDVAGEEGRCRPGRAGRAPVPACAGSYACNGLMTTCPLSCTSDGGCVESRCGTGGVCIQKLEKLVDDFSSGDVAHDVFSTAWRRYDAYTPDRPMRPWLFGIAFRIVSNRKASRAGSEQLEAGLDDRPGGAHRPDELMEGEVTRRHVLRALDALPLDQRAVFVGHDIEHTPITELARELEVPLNTAYSRLRLARQRFQSTFTALQNEVRA